MEDRKAFEILNLRPGASLTEAKKVYKVMVKSFHPDRFHNDPIKMKEGDNKLKDINLAFAQVKRVIEDNQRKSPQAQAESQPKPAKQARPAKKTNTQTDYRKTANKGTKDKTGFFKDFWLNILKQFHQHQFQKFIKENDSQPHGPKNQQGEKPHEKNFRRILEEIEKNIKNKSAVNINQGKRDFTKVRLKKKLFKNVNRRTDKETGRVEPVSKIRPIGKIGGE
jgi:curved DNA-binding protein CbpA